MIKLQPASRTDHITDDGTELTQRPYPFWVNDDGDILGGLPTMGVRVIGFQIDLARHELDLRWADVRADPQLAVGKYLVASDADGGWSVHMPAIETVEVMS